MSDTHTHSGHSGAPAASGKFPARLVLTVFFSLVVPVIIIASLIGVFTADHPPVETESARQLAIAMRIQKVGSVQLGEASHEAKSGEEVFKGRCSACHGTGALGSPKFGDASAWGPRIKAGFDALWHSALKGKGNMSPQGGGDLTDFEIARGVVYMANAGGAKFPEPTPPAADAAKK